MNLLLGVKEAQALFGKVHALGNAAQELSLFAEQDPGLAGDCGVEVNALEARNILGSGVLARISQRCLNGSQTLKSISIPASDLEQLQRLEGVLSVASSRIDMKIAAIDASQSQDGMAKLGTAISFATGAIGLWKSIF